MAHTKRIPATKAIAFQGSPGSGKTRQAIALFALFAHRYHERHGAFQGQPLPTWAYRLIRAWRANLHTTGDAPRALPIAVSTPMRVTTTWEREIQGAYPEAEVMRINHFRDVDAWMQRCATATAPVVVGIFSQSKTRAFGLEWGPAVITKTTRTTQIVTDEAVARRAIPRPSAQGIVWDYPDYTPVAVHANDPRLEPLLTHAGFDPDDLWIREGGRIVAVGEQSFEVSEARDDTLTLHPLTNVEPLRMEGKLVGWTHPFTGGVITAEQDVPRFYCPDCGAMIMDYPRGVKPTGGGADAAGESNAERNADAEGDSDAADDSDADDDDGKNTIIPVTSLTYFTKKPRRCRACNSHLWQQQRTKAGRTKWAMPTFAAWSAAIDQLTADGNLARLGDTPATNRISRVEPDPEGGLAITLGREGPSDFSPYAYLSMKYPGCVAHHAADEAHNARGVNTDIARSIHYAWQGAQTRSMLSGTISGGMLDGLYHLLYRFNPTFWQRMDLGWNDLSDAITRYGFERETVTEHEGDALRGSGETTTSVTVRPAPGMSASLIPLLMEQTIFIDAEKDLGSFMPDLEEIPDVVDMEDPVIDAQRDEMKAALDAAKQAKQECESAYQAVMNDLGATDAEREEAKTALDDAIDRVATVMEHHRTVEDRLKAVDLNRAYTNIVNTLDEMAEDRIKPAMLAKGMLPRWWATLPCIRPAFTVTQTLRGDWGDVESFEVLFKTPVLAEDYHYPLERRLIHHVQTQVEQGRSVMIYIEQNDIRSTPKRLEQVLAAFAPWSLPNSVDPEDREDAIRAAHQRGTRVFIVPYRRVSEGLNLQFLDTIVWYEMALNYYHLRQANQRIQRLGATNLKQVIYLVYRGSVAHRKLCKLGEQSGSATLFAGDTPEGALVKTVGADRTTLARMSASVESSDILSDDDLRTAFAERSRRANAARKQGRPWFGVTDTLPERMDQIRTRLAHGMDAFLTPVATKPAPVTAKPAPVAAKPAPVTAKPTPVAAKPAPVTAKPAPVAATPAPVVNQPKLVFGDMDFIGTTLRKKRKSTPTNAEQLDLFAPMESDAVQAPLWS